MTDVELGRAPSRRSAPKRRAKSTKRHTVAKVLMGSVMALAMVTGLSVVFIYRDLNSNLHVLDLVGQLGNRPDKMKATGPQEPLNILVMGQDSRDGAGNNIDNLTGRAGLSDTTILVHLSADRSRAYGVSIPRDSLVARPDCTDSDGGVIPGSSLAMWNAAYALGGPACTIQQFEANTGVLIDHYVVVDFAGFKGMVDAIGGVEMCIPEDIDDRRHGIFIKAGTRKLEGQEALNYVRERYDVGNGSDIGRMKRQQAFIASMAHQVISAGTLTNPVTVVKFLEAATGSLTLDPELGSLKKISNLGYQFRGIGLDNIQFITIPSAGDPDNPNRLVWTPLAAEVWKKMILDQPLTAEMTSDVITASRVPGVKSGPTSDGTQSAKSSTKSPTGTASTSPDTTSPSPSPSPNTDLLADAGLCV